MTDNGSRTHIAETNEDLAAKIAAAERERVVWAKGRRAFRTEGAAALNPHSPRSSEHALWADGFDAERGAKRALVWSDEDGPAKRELGSAQDE
ncbi:MAG TPA: hypothetical protein VGO22_19125 [Pseudorhizobium sp.]|nr:hypothetical protein [Pseudorhizobium sp.]